VLPLVFVDPKDYDRLRKEDVLGVRDLRRALKSGKEIMLEFSRPIAVRHGLTEKQIDTILAGGLTNWYRKQRTA
jgi:aconitate hydratase